MNRRLFFFGPRHTWYGKGRASYSTCQRPLLRGLNEVSRGRVLQGAAQHPRVPAGGIPSASRRERRARMQHPEPD